MMIFYYAIIAMMLIIVTACQLNYKKLLAMMRISYGCVLFARKNKQKRNYCKVKCADFECRLLWINTTFKLLLGEIFFVESAKDVLIKNSFVLGAKEIFI